MESGTRATAAIIVMMAPLAAHAQGGAPHIVLYALGGGFAGGLLGALLACWLCKRFCGSKDQADTKR